MSEFESMNATGYGPGWSAEWEEHFGVLPNTDQTVDLLGELADGRPVLEYGVGTGRLALPLQERGLPVHGVEKSPWMVEQLRKKPGGDTLPVTMGDFATVAVDGRFGLVVLAYTTFLELPSQELQIECFHNAKRHLEPGGLFVLEVMVLHNLPAENRRCWTAEVEAGGVILNAQRVDVLTQQVYHSVVILRDGELPRVHPCALRYSSPGELDLMARIAGMRLRDRWGGWDRRPFTPHDFGHVSVYESVA